VPAQSEVAGFYAQAAGQVQQRANVPTWSTLTFTDGGQDFSPGAGQVTGWRQQLNLQDGSITTTARWRAPNGHLTDLRYVVFTDPGPAPPRDRAPGTDAALDRHRR
jgi:trehalose/maltose hydrolase-like predicted phosphorylase